MKKLGTDVLGGGRECEMYDQVRDRTPLRIMARSCIVLGNLAGSCGDENEVREVGEQ